MPTKTASGVRYYGYRYTEPVTGRWMSRDPIGERGGVNLYGFVGNDGVNGADYLGLEEEYTGSTNNVPCRIYEANPKHHNNSKGDVGGPPTNPQNALDNSVPVLSTNRVHVDRNGEISVFRKHTETVGDGKCCEKWHGYKSKWRDLSQAQKNALIRSGKVKPNGKILPNRPTSPIIKPISKPPFPPRGSTGQKIPGGGKMGIIVIGEELWPIIRDSVNEGRLKIPLIDWITGYEDLENDRDRIQGETSKLGHGLPQS